MRLALTDLGRSDPTSGPVLLVLISLAEGPRHGHAMMLDIETFSGQRLGPGTLYGALERLEDRGLIEAVPSDDRRRPYRLTAAGVAELDRRLDSLGRLTSVGTARRAAAMAAR